MQEQNFPNQHPKVIVLALGQQKLINQQYPDIEVRQKQVDNDIEWINEQLEDIEEDVIVGILSRQDRFIDENVVDTAIKQLLMHPLVGCTYSDVIISDGVSAMHQFLQPFTVGLLAGGIIINSPLFIRGSVIQQNNIRANPQTPNFYLFKMFLDICQKKLGIHIASPLFISDVLLPTNTIQQELELCQSQ